MKIKFSFLDEYIELRSCNLYTVVIENKRVLYDFEEYLYNDYEYNEKFISLVDDNKELDNKKFINFIPSFHNFDINNKKNLTSLYKIIKNTTFEEIKEKYDGIIKNIEDLMMNLSINSEFDLLYENDVSIEEIFKLINLRIDDNEENLPNKIVKYIEIINKLQGISIFLVMNVHDYLNNEEIKLIIKELKYKGVTIINIEKHNSFDVLDEEILNILDIDLCTLQ